MHGLQASTGCEQLGAGGALCTECHARWRRQLRCARAAALAPTTRHLAPALHPEGSAQNCRWSELRSHRNRCRIQSLFNALGEEAQGKTIGLGGDGRYFNKEAVQVGSRCAGWCHRCWLAVDPNRT